MLFEMKVIGDLGFTRGLFSDVIVRTACIVVRYRSQKSGMRNEK